MLKVKPLTNLLAQFSSTEVPLVFLITIQGALLAHHWHADSSNSPVDSSSSKTRTFAALASSVWAVYVSQGEAVSFITSGSSSTSAPTDASELSWISIDCSKPEDQVTNSKLNQLVIMKLPLANGTEKSSMPEDSDVKGDELQRSSKQKPVRATDSSKNMLLCFVGESKASLGMTKLKVYFQVTPLQRLTREQAERLADLLNQPLLDLVTSQQNYK